MNDPESLRGPARQFVTSHPFNQPPRMIKASRAHPAWCLLCLVLILSADSYLASSDTNLASIHPQSNPQTGAAGTSSVTPSQNNESVTAYCERLSQGKGQDAALDAVCEFALSLFWKLPNVISDEERVRYQVDQLGSAAQRDVITAKVRFEDGQEQYDQITINGKPAPVAVKGSSGWSEGEFAADLRALFLPQSATQFKFAKQDALRGSQVLVFDFKVLRRNNHLRYLQADSGTTTLPGYHGRLWINQSTLHLMRLERKVDDVAADFAIQRADLMVEYADVDLADGTTFVLPLQAVNVSCPSFAPSYCWHNQLSFKHWHKFAARARVLTGQEEPPAQSPATSAPPAEPQKGIISADDVLSIPVPMDLQRGASIAAEMLNDQIAEVERSQRQAEAAAAAPVEANKVPPKTNAPTQVPVTAAANAPTEFPGDQLPTFKTSARLVLVPAVVRDSHAHTVDHLQKADFRLLDDRREQPITQFSVERPGSFSAAPGESAGGPMLPAKAAPARHAAYVFDDIHASLDDLVRARDAAKRHLTSLPPGDRAAVFTLSASVMLDFTDDGAKLKDALDHTRPHPLTATGPKPCPNISYEQADLIQNHNDAVALAEATAETLQCAFGGDPNARFTARRTAEAAAARVLNSARAESQLSFKVLTEVVHEISRMPGQRSVVLVSPGFPTAELEQQLTEIIDGALHAGVIINVLDPTGLSTESQVQYGTGAGRSDVLIDLASGTGGTFFHNRNDMNEGFLKTALPDILYVLGFSPRKLDGKFHKLMVTVQRPEKLSVQARRGYYASKPAN
jgi:VWFA-related protein